MRKIPGAFHYPLAPLVLPAVYDDVLSYEEWLSKVIHKLNELTEYINHVMEEVDERIDNKLAPVIRRIEHLEREVSRLDQKIDTTTQELRDYIDAELVSIRNDFDVEINKYYLLSKRYTDQKVGISSVDLRAQIKAINDRITRLAKEFPLVYSPSKGYFTNVERSIVETWNSLRYFGIKAYDYDLMEFTAEAFERRCLQALQYDLNAMWIYRDELREMFNPFTGKHESIKSVVAYISNMLKWNGKKANQYDGYEFTAGEFDASTFSAYPQDSNQYYTEPDIDLKNRAYQNYLFRGTISEGTPSLSTVLKNAGYLVLSQVGTPDVITVKAESAQVVLLSGTSVTITVTNDEATLVMDAGNNISVYTATHVYDVTELDA